MTVGLLAGSRLDGLRSPESRRVKSGLLAVLHSLVNAVRDPLVDQMILTFFVRTTEGKDTLMERHIHKKVKQKW